MDHEEHRRASMFNLPAYIFGSSPRKDTRMSDKIPALPHHKYPRTKSAQDDRIKELEGDDESTSKRLGDMQLELIGQANKIEELERSLEAANAYTNANGVVKDKRIAELEREIREAWKFVKLCFFPLHNRLDIQQRDEWLARNEDKEQTS